MQSNSQYIYEQFIYFPMEHRFWRYIRILFKHIEIFDIKTNHEKKIYTRKGVWYLCYNSNDQNL